MEETKLTIHINKKGHNVDLSFATSKPSITIAGDAENNFEERIQFKEGLQYEYEFSKPGYTLRGSNELLFPSKFNKDEKISRGVIKTGIFVGSAVFKIFKGEEEVDTVGIEIRSVKTSYREDYRQMMLDITNEYTDLVMQQGSPVNQKFSTDYQKSSQTLYQRFSFVKSIIESEQFSDAIHKILSSPIHRWRGVTQEKDITAVRKLTGSNLRQIVTTQSRIPVHQQEISHYHSLPNTELPNGLTSLPRKLTVASKTDTVDTPENRFVKYVLYQFLAFCNDFMSMRKAGEQLKKEASQTADIIFSFLNNNLFKEVSLPQSLALNSPALQRKEGYREVLQAWLLFDLAAMLGWKGGDNIYSAGKRNVAALYEYWLFFKLKEIISGTFSLNPVDLNNLIKTDEDNINLDLVQGHQKVISGRYDEGTRVINVRFYYNRSFSHNDKMDKAGSWTATMRPDYTLSVWPGDNVSEEEAEEKDMITHIHFDAKYRVDKLLAFKKMEQEDLDQEKVEQEKGDYKRADLLKMHAYKDAIRRTSGAYILYPGDGEDQVFRGFHEIIPGLGAFSIKPKDYDKDARELKEFIRLTVNHLLDRTSQRENIQRHDHNVHKQEKKDHERIAVRIPESVFPGEDVKVVVGYYKSLNQEFIEKVGYPVKINTRGNSVKINKDLLQATYTLLYNEKHEVQLYKLKQLGHNICTMAEIKSRGYNPQSFRDENSVFMMLRIDQEGLENEWKEFDWHYGKIILPICKNKGKGRPLVYALKDLLLQNKEIQ